LPAKATTASDARAAREFLDAGAKSTDEIPRRDLQALENALAQKPALVIDGLFGIGLNRPLDDGWKKFIAAVNAVENPRAVRGCAVRPERGHRRKFWRGH
jgi:NAD(P)H-hydrate repair Nnr-like enzyme with NAD(P)H-hydrate epimerase domain